ncbi:MAG: DUF951 domain-containing protein [Oscillospiraceae bacterium]|nr:DUF951 domain-containing protein [Oscillospiraceae bacterium]MDD4369155.1 DUF951 domain-containing protein [Oscillospiraceae bacterium]
MANRYFLYKFQAGMQVKLKKAHPCGGRIWDIVSVGADIRLRCQTCGHYLLMPRRKFELAVTDILSVPELPVSQQADENR